MGQRLLTNETGHPDGPLRSGAVEVPDHRPRSLYVWGAFGEAEVLVETSPNGEAWFSEARVTTEQRLPLTLPPGTWLRVSVTGASGATRLTAEYV